MELKVDQKQEVLGALFSKLEHPVLPVGPAGEWDCLGMSEPTIVRDGSIYRLYYEGLGSADNSWRVGLATSPDLIHWTKHSHNPVLGPNPDLPWANTDVLEPYVMKDGPIYRMWYTANLYDTSERSEIGYAISRDGLCWEMIAEPAISFDLLAKSPAGFTGASEPAVIKRPDGRGWIMYFQAWRDGISHVGYAVSDDGVRWTIPGECNPVIESGDGKEWDSPGTAGPDVAYHHGCYYLFYNSWRAPGGEGIGLAASRDGLRFTKFPGNPILTPSSHPDGWDRHSVYEPGIWVSESAEVALLFGGLYSWNGRYDETTKLQIGAAFGRLPDVPDAPGAWGR